MRTEPTADDLLGLFPPGSKLDGDGTIVVGGCRLDDVAAEFGTPAIVVAEDALRNRAREYLDAFRSRWPRSDLAFASKSFPCTAVQRVMVEEGLHLDVAGGGEILTAVKAGADPARLVLHGNAKTDEELELAVEHGLGLVVIDNFDDIDRLERIVPQGHRQHCLVRVIPGVEAATHASQATGHAGSKFGLLPDDARDAIARVERSSVLQLDGVHTHVGSQLLNVEQLAAAVEPIAKLGTFETYDLGGGLGVRYTYDEHPPTVDDYAEAMVTQARELLPDGSRIIIEPGRSMVATNACTVYRVTTIKRGVVTHVAVDGGMGDNLEVSLTGQRFEATIVDRVGGGGEIVTVVGRHCESGDQLVDGIALREPVVGDLLAVPVTGAYCYTMSNQYNGARRVPVVFARDGEARLVVRRDTWDDLLIRDVAESDAKPARLATWLSCRRHLANWPVATESPPNTRTGPAATSDVPETTLVAVLAALGVPATTEEERAAALVAHDRDYWGRALPPTIVGRAGAESSFWVHVTHGDPVGLWIRLEDGSVRAGLRQLENHTPPYDLGDRLVGEATFELPADLPLGYHRLHVHSGTLEANAPLIVAPATLDMPARLGAKRTWGLATQLYSVASERSWGIGDLTDLTDLAVWSGARHGAGYILVNPLHAAAPTAPMEPSPYLPTSRRFVNPLYLRVEAIPEFADVRHRRRIRKARVQLADSARGAELIDRDTAWQAKRDALKNVYRVGRSAGRELAYAAYREREGRSLDDFAIWCALAEEHGPDWHRWPEAFAHPENPAVADFAAEHADTVDFHRWLQWQLDDQLAAAQSTAMRTGMELGIMHDLAVGVDPNGADAWALQDVLALGVTAGAPPDEFNQLGQDWSQPPWRPDQLIERGYEPFRAMVERGAPARGRRPRRPHHRAVPALVDPQGCAADRGHLCALRPRGDDRHPRARGPPRRVGGGRRGPRHGRAVGTALPRPSRTARHIDPLVRARPRRRRRSTAGAALARILPVLGDNPRPAPDGRLSGR